MTGCFSPNELTVLQRIVELAAAELGITDEKEKSLIAVRAIAVAERGEWNFDLLLSHAKGIRPVAWDARSRPANSINRR
jgi:hypothetical protein